MEANLINPIIIPANAAVLLCFLSGVDSPGVDSPGVSVRQRSVEHATLNAIMSQLQKRLPPSVRMLRIDEAVHPEVVKSFNVSELPAFVLVRQGVEQWRREGIQAAGDVAAMPDFMMM
ncbi:MAG: thioredoxin [Spirosoma sp.]|nr:thioredoxin [Spirosoma sp.]